MCVVVVDDDDNDDNNNNIFLVIMSFMACLLTSVFIISLSCVCSPQPSRF